ncbi:hypothetical protein MMC26_007727 [Xylographa opegraphella]|nr:hypothetical protein [Xylographa opegraphella]
MGQHQSSEEKPGSGGDPLGDVKTCYYELLNIQPQSSDEEIKKAYRKKALELHPDRNYSNVEETTKLFAEVQVAYDILSDSQERAWYDSHREAILGTEDPKVEDHYEHNVRVTTAGDIMKMFMNFDGQLDYSDTSLGFYSSLRSVFATLAREESTACECEGYVEVEYPSFGSSKDTYECTVKAFYSAWSSFATRKTFSWKNVYRYSEAPDRKVRRTMEKENKRYRDEAIKEFNEAVRALVAFVKKRDPRYMPNRQTEAERQQILREKAVAQATRSRAANQAKLKQDNLPDWAKFTTPEEVDFGADESAEEFEPEEHFECVICKKSFKSEKQWEAHEKSKKHVKAVQHLCRTMQKEDEAISLDNPKHEPRVTAGSSSDREAAGAVLASSRADLIEAEDVPLDDYSKTPERLSKSVPQNVNETSRPTFFMSPSEFNEAYASREEAESRISWKTVTKDSSVTSPLPPKTSSDDQLDAFETLSVIQSKEYSDSPKMGKAKEKRAKKAAQKTSNAAEGQLRFKCVSCMIGFSSKTQLFNHIKDFDHAAPVVKAAGTKKTKNQ